MTILIWLKIKMKFTEEKLEKAFDELLGKKNYQVFCTKNLTNLKMSSFFANILDKLTIFALK